MEIKRTTDINELHTKNPQNGLVYKLACGWRLVSCFTVPVLITDVKTKYTWRQKGA